MLDINHAPNLSQGEQSFVADYARCLADKNWRLNNLYKITDKAGKVVTFHPNEAQRDFYENRHGMDLIVKCRQRGFTTGEQIDMLDDCLFIPNTQARVIAHTKEDAQDFFKGKIKFAYDNLPAHIREAKPATSDAARELAFANGSRISVGVSGRSGTFQRLHISEFGKLCAQRPDKAEEVITGALPALAIGGKCTIESTAEGTIGAFHDMSMAAKRRQGNGIEPLPRQFKVHFYPWWDAREYVAKAIEELPVDLQIYFAMLERDHGIVVNGEQQSWYMQEEEMLKSKMKREHPSFFDEAFEASIQGAYFSRQMAQLRTKRQITRVPIAPGVLIHTFWDLGRDTTSIWFFQQVGFDFRFVDYYENDSEGLLFYIQVLKDRRDGTEPYLYGDAYLPHDGTHRSISATQSPAEQLYEAGFQVRVVPRTTDKTLSIERARLALPMCWFDRNKCEKGLNHLDNYRKEWDEKHGVWQKQPRHDEASHGADAYQTFADGYYHTSIVEEEGEDVLREAGRNSVTGY